jgi:hypothetical protein
MPIPPLPLSCRLLLRRDECAPDGGESFENAFPAAAGGLTLAEFKLRARREDFDDGFATYWYLGRLILSISADDPFYELHEAPPSIPPCT